MMRYLNTDIKQVMTKIEWLEFYALTLGLCDIEAQERMDELVELGVLRIVTE